MVIVDTEPLVSGPIKTERLGNTLGVKVVAILHAGRRQLAPDGTTSLRAGDVLFVDGQATDVEELLRLQGVEIRAVQAGELPVPHLHVCRGEGFHAPGRTVVEALLTHEPCVPGLDVEDWTQ